MSSVLIKYKDIAVGAKEDFEPTISEQHEYSDIGLLKFDFLQYKDLSNPCEFYNFALDGNETPLAENYQDEDFGVWSEQFSDENGDFATPIVLTAIANELYTSSGLSMAFDTDNNIYPTSVNIKWYRDDTLLYDINYEPNNAFYFFRQTVEYYNKIVITFNSLCLPYNRLKIRELDYGLNIEFTGKDLLSAKAIQEISPISAEIAINTFDFTLINAEQDEYTFQRQQPLTVYFDNKLVATQFIKQARQTSKSNYSIQTEDYIGLLDSIMWYGGVFDNYNAKTLLTEIFTHANVPCEISADFDLKTVSGYIPYGSCRNAIMQIAFAIGAVVDTSYSDKVDIYALDTTNQGKIPLNRIMQGQSFSRGTKISAVEVMAHGFVQNDKEMQAFSAEQNGTGDNILIKFNSPLHTLSITNGTIIESGTNYALINASEGCILKGLGYDHTTTIKRKLNPLVLANDIENIVSIQNATLVSKNNLDEVIDRCFNYYVNVDKINTKIVEGKHREDGVLVDDQKTQVGQKFTIETEYLGDLVGIITSQRFSLGGNIIIKETELTKL